MNTWKLSQIYDTCVIVLFLGFFLLEEVNEVSVGFFVLQGQKGSKATDIRQSIKLGICVRVKVKSSC